ncbi:MAG: peptidase and in kexin sedolisin [Candidatus Saccharibacteria bacterium]|nr:peptidase and in kexin sedolisin [Candidatus Saccharibacteria bacterium]
MKQTTKNIIHSLSHLLLFGGVILAVGNLKQLTPAPSTSPTTPSSTQQKTVSNIAPQPTTQPTKESTSFTVDSVQPATTSTKYDAIRQTTQQEYTYRMFSAPNDPQYNGDWTLAKVNAPAAWNIATGNGQTIVAVIDGGFGLAHEDLVNRWYSNPGETGMTQPGDRCWTGTSLSKQSNSCDDDNNGYVDDWRGWSFINSDNNPQAGRQNASGAGTQHATEVSGLVGASGNNNLGGTAINWNTKIMPLQALDDNGVGYTSGVTAAIYYAVDNGAQVINLSLGAYANDPALKTAVSYATNHNVVIVAAAGNCGTGTGDECSGVAAGTVAYPAAYPDVIAVGASTQSDQRASFSSFGPAVDVSAPGYAVPSSTSWSAANTTSLYSSALYGTSFASPQVASLAALIKSVRPSTSVNDITALIDATASKPSAMNGLLYSQQFGHGVIDAGSALSIAIALNSSSSVPVLSQAGSFQSEHSTPGGTTLGSGCRATVGSACTIQLIGNSGYKRYLPYAIIASSGNAGWSWSSDMLESDSWMIRALGGDSQSTTPYFLIKR